jgi:nucleoid-associated protein YgaU
MIFKGSRYERLARKAMPLTELYASIAMRIIPQTPATVRHVVRQHERLDLLAYEYYRDPEKFWLIADANDVMDPEDLLNPGNAILIPPDRDI